MCFYDYSISLLRNLEVLDISENDFSGGLPDDILSSLHSLSELFMQECKLKILPIRYVT